MPQHGAKKKARRVLRVAKPQRPPFKSLWIRPMGAMLEFPPAIGERASYIETSDGRVVASSARTGRPLWTRQLAAPLASKPALDSDSVYVSSLGGFVYALRQSDGAVALAIRRRRPQRILATAR